MEAFQRPPSRFIPDNRAPRCVFGIFFPRILGVRCRHGPLTSVRHTRYPDGDHLRDKCFVLYLLGAGTSLRIGISTISNHALARFQRRPTGPAFESAVEARHLIVAELVGDRADRSIRFGQQLASLLLANFVTELGVRVTVFLEASLKRPSTHAELSRHVVLSAHLRPEMFAENFADTRDEVVECIRLLL